MSTTFTTTFTVSDKNAHEELGQIAGILEAIAKQLDMNHPAFAGRTATQTVHDFAGNIAGRWDLT